MITTVLKKVYHTGTLDGRPIRRDSYEGPLLSCAENIECMEAWQSIARLGSGPCWELRLATGKSVRLAIWQKLTKVEQSRMLRNAFRKGLAIETDVYQVHFSDEEGEKRYFTFDSKQEAEEEKEALEEYENVRLKTVHTFKPTPPLAKWWCSSLDPSQWEEAIIVHELESDTTLDGIYWADRFDPASLSAPRVGLFERVLPSLSRRRIRSE